MYMLYAKCGLGQSKDCHNIHVCTQQSCLHVYLKKHLSSLQIFAKELFLLLRLFESSQRCLLQAYKSKHLVRITVQREISNWYKFSRISNMNKECENQNLLQQRRDQRDYPILSHTETLHLSRRSRCPCKYGSRESLPRQ